MTLTASGLDDAARLHAVGDSPRVSVIIPTRNAATYLEKCLSSISRQTYPHVDVVLVDERSTDGTLEIAARYPGVRVVRADNLRGPGAARNVGVASTDAEIVAFTDSDVIVPPTWVERIVSQMRLHNVVCVGGSYSGSVGKDFVGQFQFYELAFRRRRFPQFVQTAVSNNFACVRSVFLEFGGFPDQLKDEAEDMVLSYRISRVHRILWDRDNGVLHHFRSTMKSYLKSQAQYATAAVWSAHKSPNLFSVTTHHGRSLHVEVVLTGLTVALLPVLPVGSLVAAGGVILINVPFMVYLTRHRLNPVGGLGMVIARNVAAIVGIAKGLRMCAASILSGSRTRDGVPPKPSQP